MTQPVPFDAMLACLQLAAESFRLTFSATAATAGLPLEKGKLTAALLPRAAERAGMEAQTFEVASINVLRVPLPAVLERRDAEPLLLVARDLESFTAVAPGQPEAVVVPYEELSRIALGLVALRPLVELDSRVAGFIEERPSRWFAGAMLAQLRDYRHVLLSAVFVNVLALASPLFTMNVYDRVVTTHAEQTLLVLSLGMGFVALFDFILRRLRSQLVDAVGVEVDMAVTRQVMAKLLSLKMEAKPSSAGSFASQLGEFDHMREFFSSATLLAIVDLPFLFLFLGVLAMIGGWLVLIPLLAIPLAMAAAWWSHVRISAMVQQMQAASAQKQALAVETAIGLEAIKASAAESSIQYRWERFSERSAVLGARQREYANDAMHANLLLQQLVTVGVVMGGAYLIFDGKMTTGALIASSILASRALAPLAGVTGLVTRAARSMNALRGMNELMARPSEQSTDVRRIQKSDITGDMDLQGLQFRYPNQLRDALAGVTLKINAGERIGILGRSGSGKSTLLKVLVGLYDPTAGSLSIDGIDARQLDMADRRRAMSYLSQDTSLMFGSIRYNMTLGHPLATDEELIAASQIAGIGEFVRQLPLGVATVLGERGEGLSGGQKQALSMARAVLRKSPVLVFDEPTSAMDNATERNLINRLKDFVNGRTLIICTHKPAMLDLVDRLIVLEGGRVVADGPKAKVIEQLNSGMQVRRAGT
ncbi:MAG TPA: type I secretion system permease/ATPase [Solimonas sp.]|nr:type I secretion system permease/ATPase [Solimonas sp.]